MPRNIYCSICKKVKGAGCENDNRCKSCKSKYEKQRRINKRLAQGKPPERPMRKPWCETCIEMQKDGKDIRGKCVKCKRLVEDNRRALAREKLGLPPTLKNRGTFCYKCNIEKTNGLCLPCRNRTKKERTARKRAEQGKRPWGSGERPLTCFKCKKVKEHRKRSYCDECRKEMDRLKWIKKKSMKIIKPPGKFCRCGKERVFYSDKYCDECHYKKLKRDRSKLHVNGNISPKRKLTNEELKVREFARNTLRKSIKIGIVIVQPCEVCGTSLKVQGHHDDYYRPLDVRWLCRTHHYEHHTNVLRETNY